MLLTVAISQHLRPATHRTYDGRCCNTESKNSIYKHENNLKNAFQVFDSFISLVFACVSGFHR